MGIFRANSVLPEGLEFDIRATYSWDQVLTEAKLAEAAYIKSGGNVVRRLGRSIGDNASTFNQYLLLFPDGEYTSILSGGLKLMFGAAARMSDLRKTIWEAIRDVPYIVTRAERCMQRNSNDAELKELGTELYLSILAAIEGMTMWLVKKGGWKQIKALFKGPLYERDLGVKINDMQNRLSLLQYRANELQADAMANVDRRTSRIEPQVDDIHRQTNHLTSKFAALHTDWENQSAANKDQWQITQAEYEASRLERELTRQHRETRREERSRDRKAVEVQQGLLETLVSLVQNAEWLTKDDLLKTLGKSSFSGIIDSAQLQSLMQIDLAMLASDLVTSIRHAYTLPPASRARADALMTNPRFQSWLTSRHPSALLVDGNDSASVTSRTTSLSSFCATLAQALDKSSSAIHLEFFCGLHTRSNDPLRGPQGLIRTLIAQLLDRVRDVDWDLGRIAKNRTTLDRLERFELDHLCSAFSDLVRQLPYGTFLFVLVDGISFYERHDLLPYTQFALRKILELTEEEDVTAVVKVIMTAPSVGRVLQKQVHEENRLVLPSEVVGGGTVVSERGLLMETRRAQRLSPYNGAEKRVPQLKYDEYDDDEYEDPGYTLHHQPEDGEKEKETVPGGR